MRRPHLLAQVTPRFSELWIKSRNAEVLAAMTNEQAKKALKELAEVKQPEARQ